MIRLLRQNGWVVGLIGPAHCPVHRHQDDPAELRRRRFRLAGARRAAIRLRSGGADRRGHCRRHRPVGRRDDGADQRDGRLDDGRRQRGIRAVRRALRAGDGFRAWRRQRHPDRGDARARHRGDACDAVRAAGRGAARSRRARRRRRRMAEEPDRRHGPDPRHPGQRRRVDPEGACASRSFCSASSGSR